MNHKFGNARATARFNSGVLRWVCCSILLLFGIALLPALAAHPLHAVIGAGLCGTVIVGDRHARRFLEPDKDPSGGFQKQVLEEVGTVSKSVEAIKKQNDELTQNYENLHKTTKQAFEDLTQLKNQGEEHSKLLTAVKRVQLELNNERRMAFGSPIERITRDPEKKARFNAMIRMAVNGQGGDMAGVAKAIINKALGEDSSPGSTYINDALADEIYDTLAAYGAWSTLGVRKMGTKLEKYPVKTARPVAYVLMTEGDTIPDDTNKAGASVNLEVEIIACLMNVSLQLLNDAEFDVTADVMDDFVEAFNYRLDYLAFQGNGTATGTAAKLHGGMTGMFNFGTASVADTVSTDQTVETLEFEDVTRCLLTVDAGVLSRPTRWWMHPYILIRMLSIKDSNGRPIFLTATEAPTPNALGSILGSPVTLVHAAPSANVASSKVAVFGDPNAMVVGMRQDFYFEASDHHKWSALQRSFRGYGRAGVKGRRAAGLSVLTTAAAS